VEGWKIMDGILVAHEAVHSISSSKSLGMVIKLDLSKAYDHLNWNYLFSMIKAFGFSPSSIN